jgi:hypothetical protein
LTATLRAFARQPRERLLEALAALAPVLAELGGAPALDDVAEAVILTGEWWP